MANRNVFIKSINDRLLVRVTYVTNDNRVLKRKCIPFDIGPSSKFKDKTPRYHLYDLDSPNGNHPLPLLPERLLKIELTDIQFEPAKYVTWKPKWYIKRDWGNFS